MINIQQSAPAVTREEIPDTDLQRVVDVSLRHGRHDVLDSTLLGYFTCPGIQRDKAIEKKNIIPMENTIEDTGEIKLILMFERDMSISAFIPAVAS